jgi:hypothetical protein
MALEISNLSKQLETTQESVDEVRAKQEEVDTRKEAEKVKAVAPPPVPPLPGGLAPGGSTSVGRQPGFAFGMPRLTNSTPPILEPAAVTWELIHINGRPATGNSHRDYHSSPSSLREFYAKPPKHDFPKFDGTNPHMWFDLCHTYFEMYSTPQHQWM